MPHHTEESPRISMAGGAYGERNLDIVRDFLLRGFFTQPEGSQLFA